MEREPNVDECLVVARNGGNHSLPPGERLKVVEVDDDDSTIRGMVAGTAHLTDWIPWADLEPVRFGWEFIQAHLPPDLVTVLTGCDGIECVSLNKDVKLAVLATLPDLKQRIREAVQSIEADADSY